MVDTVGGHQPAGVLLQHRDLVGGRDGERVDPVVRHPAHVGVDGFGGQLDAVGVQRCQRGRHPDRPAGGVGRHDGVQFGVRRETPGAVDDHPHRQADFAVDDGGLQFTVTNLHDLAGDAVNTQVGVAGAGGLGGGQRRVGELMSGQSEKVGVNSSARCHG